MFFLTKVERNFFLHETLGFSWVLSRLHLSSFEKKGCLPMPSSIQTRFQPLEKKKEKIFRHFCCSHKFLKTEWKWPMYLPRRIPSKVYYYHVTKSVLYSCKSHEIEVRCTLQKDRHKSEKIWFAWWKDPFLNVPAFRESNKKR